MDPVDPARALVPVREETVNFYGDEVMAAQLEDGTILVPLRPLCDFLGLSWAGQLERTRRDDVLTEALNAVRVTRTASASGVAQGMARGDYEDGIVAESQPPGLLCASCPRGGL